MKTIAERAETERVPIEDLVAEFYGEGGPLSAAGWEIRPQQREMSLDIARGYDAHKRGEVEVAWNVHEAPCGTGKGLAYLVAGALIAIREQAIWRQGGRDPNPPQVVVSTANIALQEQLLRKDVPALSDMLGYDLRAILLKGRNNYLCLRETAVAEGSIQADERFSRLLREAEDGWDGDRESLSWEVGDLWPKVSRTSEDCAGRGCPHFAMGEEGGTCFWRKAINGWQRAHIAIVNHHLLALQSGMNAALLAVDEMHEIESSIRSAVSEKMTRGTGISLARRAAKVLGDEARDLVEHPVAAVMDEVEDVFRRANPRQTRWPDPVVLSPGWSGGRLDHSVKAVRTAFGEIRDAAISAGCYEAGEGILVPPSAKTEPERAVEAAKLGNLANALFRLAARVDSIASGRPSTVWPGHDQPWAIYATGNFGPDGRLWLTAHASPADVSWAIARLQETYPVATFTSATVPEFRSLRLTCGMPVEGGARARAKAWLVEKRLPSPYPLAEMGVTIVPRGPSPKDAQWQSWAPDRVVELVEASSGGALVLASSVRMMRAYGQALRDRTDFVVKVQGEEGRTYLREWFREETDGVLVATRSFFQGLDVQGESCRLVVIDRIPFARPGDPVEEAVQRLLVQRNGGGSGYMLRSVPDAAMVLAQGAGRLIRSMTDRGAVACLDGRILKSAPGWRLLRRALPGFPTSYTVDDVSRLLAGEELHGVPVVRAKSNRLRWS